MAMMLLERNEYPRPNFRREEWLNLNGKWEFTFDDKNEGITKGYYTGNNKFDKIINVPFSYQYEASGINEKENHEIVWYKRTFSVENNSKSGLLCFNGCDYYADIWLNGKHAISHKGAFSPFSVDVTKYLKEGDNVIVVRCYDPFEPTIPRGKQSWTGEKFGCWYKANTGIWQSVWIEFFADDCIEKYSLLPDIDTCSFFGEIKTLKGLADECEIIVFYKEKLVKKIRFSLDNKYTRYEVKLMENDFVDESFYWTPENPNLFYVDFTLYKEGVLCDKAHTRFGMKKISVDENGKICLNNRPLYQRLILDQGYWEESGITPPSADAIKKDIILSKELGFNGARKHQKFEDPYFYYYAEELGFLTWCEMPSAYTFNTDEIFALMNEWQEIVSVARNFTSNVCYVPLNESWGVRKILLDESQQNFARAMYYITKSLNSKCLVSTNDGWEIPDVTDIVGIHDYAYDSKQFTEKYNLENYEVVYPQGRKLLNYGCKYNGQPVLLTEFGGIAMASEEKDGNWGYNNGARNEDEFLIRYENLLNGIYAHKDFQGFCYTQLTDVQQEVNGLLKADRTPKFNVTKINKITKQNK